MRVPSARCGVAGTDLLMGSDRLRKAGQSTPRFAAGFGAGGKAKAVLDVSKKKDIG